MVTAQLESKADLITKVTGLVRRRLPRAKAELIAKYLGLYYGSVPSEDLADRSADDLYGAALSHWNFAQVRAPDTALVRVYNPVVDEHDWQSSHTVIEIVNDDMPFLIDSVASELNRRDLTIHLVIHPILRIQRNAQGQMTNIFEPGEGDDRAKHESFIRTEVDRRSAQEALDVIAEGVRQTLRQVRLVVADWRPMLRRLYETVERLETTPPPLPEDQVKEVGDFLRWIGDSHFTFIGFCAYRLHGGGYEDVPESALGLLRDPAFDEMNGVLGGLLPPEVQNFLQAPRVVMITRSKTRSPVHRPVPLDQISVKTFDKDGEVTGEFRFMGLFTSVAYSRSPLEIPLLRRRVLKTVERSGLSPESHDGKALINILETFPRNELFQISSQELLDISLGILHLQERQRTRLFVRQDPYERTVSCLVYVPRDRYNTDLRMRMHEILLDAFMGESATFTVHVSDEPLARVHFIIETVPGKLPAYDAHEIERRIIDAVQTWTDALRERLVAHFGEEQGLEMLHRYEDAFPTAYREEFGAQVAALDIEKIESIAGDSGPDFAMDLYSPFEQTPGLVKFKLFQIEDPVPLSDILPVLEDMGFKVIGERPFLVEARNGTPPVWIHDFNMLTRPMDEIDLAQVRDSFHEAFARVWTGEMENDGFNRLVLLAGLSWREVVLLRAYCKHLRQAGIPFSQDYMEETLAQNSMLTKLLVELFRVRFDPKGEADIEARVESLDNKILQALEAVVSLDEDRILRRYRNAILATLRTNYFQTADSGEPKPYLALKLDSSALEELPLPRPFVEIFVYSPRMEGIHLRGGKVARGGIRWSDRREDFRTEVLGLMKSQMVKNAVIVPVGAKGGFVCKRIPEEGGRKAVTEEGIACYKTLINGLLDLTDNLVGGEVIPPLEVRRWDDDDSYLVVAADKGTATFSDIANEISCGRGFWLGDAFASGGATGYDHKKMGITARGAWISVERHFREIGVDIEDSDFDVVGIGDMSGDVFGNGMLLSEHIRLVGAFNHRHVFLDPDPDAGASFAERKRLFELPRSSWADYNPKLISKGGGVFKRRAKSIPLSPELKERFGLEADHITPNEMIRTLLRAEMDLLWLGGIGTYVKASFERDFEVGDRTNDAVRVDADGLRCRVIGEGANLGLTQRGRIEYARRGGRINTDAIDNSGGVDCSDREVNIKILLDQVVAAGRLDVPERNRLLSEMTDEVARLVLHDNYLQTQAISINEARSSRLIISHERLIKVLEREGRLNRKVEALASEEEFAEREMAGEGLSRPEIAVLLAYAKIDLFSHLVESDAMDDPFLAEDLVREVPQPLRERFGEQMKDHPLRREAIATMLASSLVNRTGPSFVHRIGEESGADAADVARAYTATRHVFEMRSLWSGIEALDGRVPAQFQIEMFWEAHRLTERGTLWFLRNCAQPLDISLTIEAFASGVAAVTDGLEGYLAAEELTLVERAKTGYLELGVPEDLARRVAIIDGVIPACGIVAVAEGLGVAVEKVCKTYFEIGVRIGFDWLRTAASLLKTTSHWQRRALTALVDDFYSQQTALAAAVLKSAAGLYGDAAIETWIEENRSVVERTRDLLDDLRTTEAIDLSMLTVANRQIRTLIMG